VALLYSSLAQVCRAFAQQLSAAVNGPSTSTVRVLIGTPADAAPGDADHHHSLNLFFFRFETSGFDGAVLPGEPWLLRLHCLVTPFCVGESPVTSGENDLRLLGEVLRHVHEAPLAEITLDTGDAVLLQTIFLNLGLDQINQLWSTQGDAVYRPSLLLEISLAPILPRNAAVAAPLVAGLGLDVRATRLRTGEGLEGIVARTPELAALEPDTALEDWAPELAIVDQHDATPLRSASFALGSARLASFAPRAWLAGLPGTNVVLRWSTWERSSGWREAAAPQDADIAFARIDPAAVPATNLLPALALPFDDRPGQLMLVAERSYTRAADGAAITVRSAPVLVNLYQGGP